MEKRNPVRLATTPKQLPERRISGECFLPSSSNLLENFKDVLDLSQAKQHGRC